MTLEGKVKDSIKKLLAKYDIQPAAKAGTFEHAEGWYYSAVQGPMSVRGIPDFLGHYRGYFWAIEAKAPGKNPTGFQELQISAIRKASGKCFVVSCAATLDVFEMWLQEVQRCSNTHK